MTNDLVVRTLDGQTVRQREADGYVNATELCRAAGKQVGRITGKTRRAQEFVTELEWSLGIPRDHVVQSITTGPNESRGTWIHPDIAIHLAQWCSARFAVQVSRWVRELLTTGSVSVIGTGDPLLDSLQIIHRTAGAIVEVRERQLVTEREVAEVRGIALTRCATAVRAEQTATAALNIAECNLGHFTVLAYCNLTNRRLTQGEATTHGRRLSNLCRTTGRHHR